MEENRKKGNQRGLCINFSRFIYLFIYWRAGTTKKWLKYYFDTYKIINEINAIEGNKLMVYGGICTANRRYTEVYLPASRTFSVFHVSDLVQVVDFPVERTRKQKYCMNK